AIVQGFAQMKTFGNELSFAPFLPKAWRSYAFHINYRGRLIFVTVNAETVNFRLLEGEPLRFNVYEEQITLNETCSLPLA
ncbi:MAG: glycoside hydrolase family 65 protein, partial [Enterococcus sp.]|nr:glycoside hydrolase family 65 protein [Enterococcus sp.]